VFESAGLIGSEYLIVKKGSFNGVSLAEAGRGKTLINYSKRRQNDLFKQWSTNPQRKSGKVKTNLKQVTHKEETPT